MINAFKPYLYAPTQDILCLLRIPVYRFKDFFWSLKKKKKKRITACGTGDMNWLQEITKLLRQQSASGQAFSAVGGTGLKHV